VRLLHCGDGVPKDALRPVLHRALNETGPRGRHDQPARLGWSPSRLGTSRSPEVTRRSTSCSGIETRSSPGHSTRSFERRESRWLRHPSARRGRTRSRSGRSWSVRRECLDHVLILGRRHLLRVLGAYTEHYNLARPHRSLQLQSPEPGLESETALRTSIRHRDVLGGIIHEYRRSGA
jgi:hypothetical protein